VFKDIISNVDIQNNQSEQPNILDLQLFQPYSNNITCTYS